MKCKVSEEGKYLTKIAVRTSAVASVKETFSSGAFLISSMRSRLFNTTVYRSTPGILNVPRPYYAAN